MKKTLLLLSLVFTTAVSAQTVITFEDLNLAPQTHYNGSDNLGGFTSNGLLFPNVYDTTYQYWSGGFIYSNTTDVTTAGYGNEFSSYAGGGATSSANYAVCKTGEFNFGQNVTIESFDISNTTYAALSMLNGDAFAKVFGSPNGADGNPDGTNGEDYFRLLIIGKDAQANVIDTVIFYLADYRFPNTSSDYIATGWQTINLTSLGTIRTLEFVLESTDMSFGFINTPAYFGMDNLRYGTLDVPESSMKLISISPNPTNGNVQIVGASGILTVTNTSGAIVYTSKSEGNTSISTENWASGLYTVTVQGNEGVSRAILVKN